MRKKRGTSTHSLDLASLRLILEAQVLDCTWPVVEPQFTTSQTGFGWGLDVQVYAPLEALRIPALGAGFLQFIVPSETCGGPSMQRGVREPR